MGHGVGASSGLQSLFPARHDGGGLRMKRNSQAMLGDDLETLEHGAGRRRRQIAEGVAHEAFESGNAPLDQRLQLIDIGLYGLLAEDNIDQFEALIAGGIAGCKCFMGNTFGNLPSPSTGAMLEGFEIVAQHGLRIALHAETASIMARREKRLQAAGRTDPLAHLASRPAVVAVEAVSRAAIL